MKHVSGKRMVQVLKKHGWVLDRIQGSHHQFRKTGNPNVITVPVHGNKPLKTGLQHDIMRKAGLKGRFGESNAIRARRGAPDHAHSRCWRGWLEQVVANVVPGLLRRLLNPKDYHLVVAGQPREETRLGEG